jgi:hypothetical protein
VLLPASNGSWQGQGAQAFRNAAIVGGEAPLWVTICPRAWSAVGLFYPQELP